MPERNGRALWEKLVLDGFQAGLSWITVLRKRDAFRRAFAGFDPVVVARFTEMDIVRLLADPGIIRSRAKIEATVGNARAFLRMREAGEEFGAFVWGFVDDVALQPPRATSADIPAETDLSRTVSKALRARGFRFCGPVITWAWMEASGLVNDHLLGCFRHHEVATLAKALPVVTSLERPGLI